jgi:hypothetical protein
MDRREALKKMMAGGAVVAGASMVSTSKVFAAGSVPGQPVGPGLTSPPPTVMPVSGKRNATWQITAPNVTCSSGTMQVSSSAVGQTLAGSLSVLISSPSGFGFMAGANTATFTVVGTGPGNSPFRRGDAFQVIWTVKYECMVNGQLAGCLLVTYTYRFINQTNGTPTWQLAPGYPTASSSNC